MALEIAENFPLAPLTTLKVGGAARFFAAATNENEIAAAVDFARQRNLKIFVLGGGSNVVVSDRGFDGLVLKIGNRGIEISQTEAKTLVTAQAGEDWDEFVRFCVERNLAGVECLSGIPGSCGGTPVQNVGAYGQDVAETIAKVRVLKRATGEIFDLSNADCRFGYRTSIFNTSQKDEFIVVSVSFRLIQNGKPKTEYADIKKFFEHSLIDRRSQNDAARIREEERRLASDANREFEPTLNDVRFAVLQIRRAKSMVVASDDPNSRSVGSFFKNPVVSRSEFEQIAAAARRLNLLADDSLPPHFPAGGEALKIPAAWLIEKSGFGKGYTKNKRAAISANHTLALVNLGAATAADVLELASEIKKRVCEIFAVELMPEPIFIGFDCALLK